MVKTRSNRQSDKESLSLKLVNQKQEPSSFSHEIITKEEVIVEDELKPLKKSDIVPEKNNEPKKGTDSQRNIPESPKKSEKDWHCEKCNKNFSTSRAYSIHKYRHRVVEAGKFSCEKCERRFTNNHDLGLHQRRGCKGKKVVETPETAEGKFWACKDCNRVFRNPTSYYNHTYKHRVMQAGKFKCDLCKKNFRDKYALRKHKVNVHNITIKSIRKTLIKESSDSETEQAETVVEKDANGFLKCLDCDKRFEFRHQYTVHVRQHYALKHELYKCKICQLIFKSSFELKRHERAHERQQTKLASDQFKQIRPEATLKEEGGIFKCSECEKTFAERKLALRHLMRHAPAQRSRVQCKLCPLTFVNKKFLEKHQVEHENQPDKSSSSESESGEESADDSPIDDEGFEFKCTVCKKSFWEKRLLNRHIRRHEAIKESKFPCKFCDVRCGDKRELIRHEEMHARKQQTTVINSEKVPPIIVERNNHTVYKCPDCAIIFDKQRVYFTHAQTHVNVRNGTFKCEICGMCCPTKKNLYAHKMKHVEGKPTARPEDLSFECPECGKKFARSRYLIQHVQRHEAVESGSFQCTICARYFGSRVLLMRHQVVHETSEEFKCSECDKICASKRSLASHLLRHETKRSAMYKCTVCEKNLGSKYDFDMHVSKHSQKERDQIQVS